MTDEIRKQIEGLREAADDWNLCGVDAGRSGQCHASWKMDEAADTMEKLLAVYEAAGKYVSGVELELRHQETGIRYARLFNELEAFEEALK